MLLLGERKSLSACRKWHEVFYIILPQSLHMHSGNWTLHRCMFPPVGWRKRQIILQSILGESRQMIFYCTEESDCFLLFPRVPNIKVTQTWGEENRKVQEQVTAPLRAAWLWGTMSRRRATGNLSNCIPSPQHSHSGQTLACNTSDMMWQDNGDKQC